MTHATLSLAERFASSAPVKKELDNLRRLAGGDELLEAAAGAIPEEAAAKGIPTVPQLKQRWGCVFVVDGDRDKPLESDLNEVLGGAIASLGLDVTCLEPGMLCRFCSRPLV